MVEKINILIDLDETILSSEPLEHLDFNDKHENQKRLKFKFYNMEGYFIIFERPNLQQFLDYIFANFNVSVWTAATKDYALFIVDKIILQDKPERTLDYIFFSYHVTVSKTITKNIKDLSILWNYYKLPNYSSNNTFIIDDYKAAVFDPQKERCILMEEFSFKNKSSYDDVFLPKLMGELKILKENFDKNSDVTKIIPVINQTLNVKIVAK